MAAIQEQRTPKHYVDQLVFYIIDESSLLRVDPDEKLELKEQASIFLNSTITAAKTIIELPTKLYIDSLHESSRNRQDLSSVFNDQGNEFDNNKLPSLDRVSINRNPSSDNEVASKRYIDDDSDKKSIPRVNRTLEK